MKNTILSFTILFFLFSACKKTDKTTEVYAQAIAEGHRILDSLQQNGKVPGIDVGVAIDGKMVWSEGFGFADLELQVPINAGKTRFRIGSVSKPITAAALGKLIDEGKLDLDTTIQTYVPYFPEKKYPITVKQIAGHLSGIRHYQNLEFLMQKRYDSVRSGIAIFSEDSLLFEPGSKYSYSSYGFNLLSAAVEGITGEQFLNFMQKEVFNPLEMISTTADKNDSIIINRTSFYQLDSLGNIINAPYVDNSYKWAGGGFISTTSDLAKFGFAHMTPGFLSESTLHEFVTSQLLNNGESTDYGIGWFTINNGQLKGYGHGGGSIGGITSFSVYPAEKMVVVILSNSSDTRYGNIPTRLAKIFASAKGN